MIEMNYKEYVKFQLDDWETKLKRMTTMTGRTNFRILYQNEVFKNMFPSVTIADELVINELLKKIGRYQR